MLVRQGFQYALRLKAQKQALLRRWVGCRRFVFNEALAHQRAELAAGRKRPGYTALCARLPALKAQHPWLAEPPAQALQQALKDLCAAWDRKYTSRFGAPRFKKRGEGDTLRLPQDCKYDAAAGVVHLPKLGAVRLRHSRAALGELKNVTLRMERGRWVASLQTEREFEVLAPATTAVVGLDFGAATTIMPSSDALAPIELPARIGRYERRMKRLQQAVSRKKRGSANRKRAVARLGTIHARIAAMRRDFLHQRTAELVRGHALIAIEDLAVKSMTASAAGTVEAPGKNVRAKAGLNRTILRNGWRDGARHARVQGRLVGRDAHGRSAGVHLAGLLGLRLRGRRQPAEPGALRVPSLWPRRTRRPQRGEEHPAPRAGAAWRRRRERSSVGRTPDEYRGMRGNSCL